VVRKGARMSLELVIFLVVLALAFDFMNGFHDAANSIATIVSTGAMRPHLAVMWAAFFNFVAFLVFGVAVATTIGRGIIDPAIVDHSVVFGALVGRSPGTSSPGTTVSRHRPRTP
jgi:PiT family inorganic phosphate transporter